MDGAGRILGRESKSCIAKACGVVITWVQADPWPRAVEVFEIDHIWDDEGPDLGPGYSLAGPVLPTIAEGDRGRDTPEIEAVRVVGRSDEDDPVDSPAAQGHQRSTATRPGPAGLPAALGG